MVFSIKLLSPLLVFDFNFIQTHEHLAYSSFYMIGTGVEGWVQSLDDEDEWKHCAVGNNLLFKSNGGKCSVSKENLIAYNKFVDKYLHTGTTVLVVTVDDELRMLIALSDTVRPTAAMMVSKMKDMVRYNIHQLPVYKYLFHYQLI